MGRLTLGPRRCGMMQNVQKSSQPSCTLMVARVKGLTLAASPPAPKVNCSVGRPLKGCEVKTLLPGVRRAEAVLEELEELGLLRIADDQGHFRHGRQGLGVALRIAAGDDDSR